MIELAFDIATNEKSCRGSDEAVRQVLFTCTNTIYGKDFEIWDDGCVSRLCKKGTEVQITVYRLCGEKEKQETPSNPQ